ncbi:MAG: redoxin domain-containing protein, partial [Planctomycetaceae bacterium]
EKPASGTPLVAIGHPRGFRFSTTTGIVSAVHTTEQLPEDIRLSMNAPDDQVWIQTNTVIAPGSSGGPLLNRRGEVVGINTWVTLDVPFGFASHAQHLTDLMARLNPQPTPVAEVNGHKATIALMSGLGEDELDPEVKALTLELKRKTEEHVAALLEAGSPRELQALERRNPLGEYVQKFLALAREKRQTPAAYQALAISLVWAPRITPESAGRRIVEEASEQLLRDHLEETSLAVVALALSETTWTESRSLLQKFSEHSPHRGVQGAACLGLALSLTRSERRPGQEDEANDEVVRLLERVVGEYGDVVIGDRELAEIAEPLLYRFKYLVVGREAPEISGQDIDGETFQLSEYRGRVVVLDFFADWCPYCARMYPHERLLVERYKDRPFVLLGVNTDEESRLRRILDERKVTWRTWADGPGGEIANRWNVRSYPTIFILDHEGVIRHHFRGTPDPDEFGRAIEQLVRRAEADQRRRPSRSREDRPADEPVVEEPVVDPTGRFLDHGAYVEDTQTGLLWQKDGDASGKRNFYEAAEYAEKLKLGGLTDWRVPTKEELAAIFPAVTPPFQDTKYTPEPCCGGPHERDTFAYWTSNLDPGVEDYAYVYQWYADGGANNGFASKNYVYVRCVHDPVNNDSAEN